MEKIKKIVFSIFLGFLILFFTSNATYAQENTYWETYFNRITEDYSQIDSFNNVTNQENIDLSQLNLQLNNLISRLNESLNIYNQSKPTLGDPQLEEAISKINSGISVYRNGLISLRDSIKANNGDNADKAVDVLNQGNNEIYEGFQIFSNRYSELEQQDNNTNNSYLLGTIVFSFISIFLFLKSRKKSKYPTEQLKIDLFKNLFKTSLWPTGGFLITLISFNSASDGHYTVATGAIIIGVISLVKQLYNYFRNVKPELDRYIEAEKILIDHYDDLLSLYHRSSEEDFVDTVVGKYSINKKSANILQSRIKEFIINYQQTENTKDPYEVLGVDKGDTLEKIKQRYKELAKKYHPDVAGKDTEEMFKEINIAYTTILSERRGY